jgi:peptide/nickel transport system substrate-binding protein
LSAEGAFHAGARVSRRRALAALAGLAGTALALGTRGAKARGRTAVGGSIAVHLPWPTAAIDPHRSDDATAAILGPALFETLYAPGDAGAVVPALAEGDPEPSRTGLRVAIRAGLRTGRDRAIDARDVMSSIARARSLGARGWLADVPVPRLDGKDALVFPTRDAARLLRALATPLAAIVPTGFSPEHPDGTGPFVANRRGDALVLARNSRAAGGPSFVDEIVVRASPDLAAPLRAFESGEDAIGWLGSGLHEPRPGARPFDFGAVAWPVLRTGREAGAWDAPGIAQRIADGIAPSRLAYLVLGPAWPTQGEEGWGGPACDLLVREDAPWLVELARAVAATISRPGHEVTARFVSPQDVAQRRGTRAFALMIDVARPLAPTPLGAYLGLATADDPTTVADIARHAPRIVEPSARGLTRTMRLGVLGDIRVQGARIPEVTLGPSVWGGVDLGSAARGGAKVPEPQSQPQAPPRRAP